MLEQRLDRRQHRYFICFFDVAASITNDQEVGHLLENALVIPQTGLFLLIIKKDISPTSVFMRSCKFAFTIGDLISFIYTEI